VNTRFHPNPTLLSCASTPRLTLIRASQLIIALLALSFPFKALGHLLNNFASIFSLAMFVAINKGSPTRASSSPSDISAEEDDNSTPSFHLDLDEADNHAGPKTPRAGAVQVLLSISNAQSEPPTSTMNIRVVKVLREKSDEYSVSYKVRMSDGFTEIVRSYISPQSFFLFLFCSSPIIHTLRFIISHFNQFTFARS
jgi:hypothetical protein